MTLTLGKNSIIKSSRLGPATAILTLAVSLILYWVFSRADVAWYSPSWFWHCMKKLSACLSPAHSRFSTHSRASCGCDWAPALRESFWAKQLSWLRVILERTGTAVPRVEVPPVSSSFQRLCPDVCHSPREHWGSTQALPLGRAISWTSVALTGLQTPWSSGVNSNQALISWSRHGLGDGWEMGINVIHTIFKVPHSKEGSQLQLCTFKC